MNKQIFAYIQPTRICNQRCIICSYPFLNKQMPLEKIKKQIDKFKNKGVTGIIITGGEPTLYKELPELIKYIISKDMEPKIITNAQKLADENYAKILAESGIKNIHISIYSSKKEIHEKITQTQGSFENLLKGIKNCIKYICVPHINIVINSLNYKTLPETVTFICEKYPQIYFFVFNYILITGRAKKNLYTVPKLADVELEIYKTAKIILENKKSFRMERVPLCYMPGFEEFSTETRQIVKDQPYLLYMLRRNKIQESDVKGESKLLTYFKSENCKVCFLKEICAGLEPKYAQLHGRGEVYPIFKNPESIVRRVLEENTKERIEIK